MKTFLILLITACYGTAMAQTALIFHKSHSGTALSYGNSFGDPSNFGVAPTRWVNHASLDSVIFLSDTAAIMVTSEYCYENRYQLSEGKTPYSLWEAGRDTVYNHPLFTQRHSLDSIRAVLFATYHFRNDTDSTKFVGFDNQLPVKKALPRPGNNQQRNDLYLLLLFIGGVFGFSFLFSGAVFRVRATL